MPSLHHFCGRFNLLAELGIEHADLDTTRRPNEVQTIADFRIQMRQHLLGQDDPGGIADLGDLERLVHTGVMTERNLSLKLKRVFIICLAVQFSSGDLFVATAPLLEEERYIVASANLQ